MIKIECANAIFDDDIMREIEEQLAKDLQDQGYSDVVSRENGIIYIGDLLYHHLADVVEGKVVYTDIQEKNIGPGDVLGKLKVKYPEIDISGVIEIGDDSYRNHFIFESSTGNKEILEDYAYQTDEGKWIPLSRCWFKFAYNTFEGPEIIAFAAKTDFQNFLDAAEEYASDNDLEMSELLKSDDFDDFLMESGYDFPAESEDRIKCFEFAMQKLKEKDFLTITYIQNKRFTNEDYTIAIPDQFQIGEGLEDRDFIAWYGEASAEDHYESDIIFYAGKKTPLNIDNPRMMTPSLSCAFAEMIYWQNPANRVMGSQTAFLPLKDGYPAGGISAGYDADSFHYNITIIMNGFMKMMRVLFQNVDKSDKSMCDQIVLEWIKTMQYQNPIDKPKKLDDSYFVEKPLSDALVKEWKDASDTRFSILANTLNIRISARQEQRKAAKGDTREAMIRDVEDYVHDAALDMEAFLDQACRGLEMIRDENPDADPAIMNQLYDIMRPAVMDSRVISTSIDGGYSNIEEEIPNIDITREWFLSMDTREETAAMAGKDILPVFEELTYKVKREVTLATLTCMIPDGMVTLDDAVPGVNVGEDFLPQLKERYSLVAIPSSFDKGFDFYTEGSFCINISQPQKVDMFAAIFDKSTQDNVPNSLKNTMRTMMIRNGFYREEYPVQYIKGDDHYGIVAAQTIEQPTETAFMFMIFQDALVMQGNIYFHAEGTRDQFQKAAFDWLRTFRWSDEEMEKQRKLRQEKERQKRERKEREQKALEEKIQREQAKKEEAKRKETEKKHKEKKVSEEQKKTAAELAYETVKATSERLAAANQYKIEEAPQTDSNHGPWPTKRQLRIGLFGGILYTLLPLFSRIFYRTMLSSMRTVRFFIPYFIIQILCGIGIYYLVSYLVYRKGYRNNPIKEKERYIVLLIGAGVSFLYRLLLPSLVQFLARMSWSIYRQVYDRNGSFMGIFLILIFFLAFLYIGQMVENQLLKKVKVGQIKQTQVPLNIQPVALPEDTAQLKQWVYRELTEEKAAKESQIQHWKDMASTEHFAISTIQGGPLAETARKACLERAEYYTKQAKALETELSWIQEMLGKYHVQEGENR